MKTEDIQKFRYNKQLIFRGGYYMPYSRWMLNLNQSCNSTQLGGSTSGFNFVIKFGKF